MSPEEQRWQKIQAQEKVIRAIIARDFSSSCMNTTKWRELAGALSGLGVTYKVKFVDDSREFVMRSFRHVTGDWLDSDFTGPFTAISIERLDINPVQEVRRGSLVAPAHTDYQEEIVERLRSIHVPHQIKDGLIRVVGHIRKSTSLNSPTAVQSHTL